MISIISIVYNNDDVGLSCASRLKNLDLNMMLESTKQNKTKPTIPQVHMVIRCKWLWYIVNKELTIQTNLLKKSGLNYCNVHYQNVMLIYTSFLWTNPISLSVRRKHFMVKPNRQITLSFGRSLIGLLCHISLLKENRSVWFLGFNSNVGTQMEGTSVIYLEVCISLTFWVIGIIYAVSVYSF